MVDGSVKSKEAVASVLASSSVAVQEINEFSHRVLRTRGGRVGSGMGILLEALWGYHVNGALYRAYGDGEGCELAWLHGHEYNDFACVLRGSPWDPELRAGELFRVEAKSMNIDADESKGHFDELSANLGGLDLLLVLLWRWELIQDEISFPMIRDHFLGSAADIARFRDQLHVARGGSFVNRADCPDGCQPVDCLHGGEPLNAAKKRERKGGPESTRPSGVSFAANFGGLVRMLKTGSPAAREVFRVGRVGSQVFDDYVSFIHRNFPIEEVNQYVSAEWREVASRAGLMTRGRSKDDLVSLVRENIVDYGKHLRDLDVETSD